MWLKVARAFAALLLGSAVWMLAQSPDTTAVPPPTPPRPQFFAGVVTDLTPEQITVTRTLVGRSPEQRSFLINPKTKMNKTALKARSRVTVRYQHIAEADVALEIHLQPSVKAPQPS